MASGDDTRTEMSTAATQFKAALASFASSPSKFRILSTITPPSTSKNYIARSQSETLYVLDSSFNPPTRAHLKIALSALIQDPGHCPKRLLLLLAIQNADKAPKPAAFEQRLALMSIFANDLVSFVPKDSPKPIVDIAVTKWPYFADKARAIDEDGAYPRVEQVHCTGYDTLIRILNPRYYPPNHTLEPVAPFLEKHRLRVTYRVTDERVGKDEQDKYLEDLRSGRREQEGGRREWAEKIVMVEEEGLQDISSTNVRKACKESDENALTQLLTAGVKEWVLEAKLYTEN